MKNKRVCAYCRVSTDKLDQINSLENQIYFFEDYIKRNDNWEMTEVYTDEGISGTSTKNRKGFNDMIFDAYQGKFNLILTKEISRFARNTLDSILYTRKLREIGVGVYFINDGINTLDADSELRLTIMSSIAQEESRKTSQRVKWGQRQSMEKGIVFGGNLLGYNVKNGEIHIDEEKSSVIKDIFNLFVSRDISLKETADILNECGHRTYKGNLWTPTAVYRILKNEKYCGDLIQKKTVTINYLTHQKIYNNGIEEKIIIKNHHEPIVSREIFEKANSKLKKSDNKRFSNKYIFSGMITCEECECYLTAANKIRKDGTVNRIWRCRKGCVSLNERVLIYTISKLFKEYEIGEHVDIKNVINKITVNKHNVLTYIVFNEIVKKYYFNNTSGIKNQFMDIFNVSKENLRFFISNVGTEELAHLEMIGAIVYQLTRNLSEKEIKDSGFDAYFVDHTTGIYPQAASGVPFTAAYLQSKGDLLTDLHENLAAEQKARTTYDNILRLCDDPDVADPIKFLRQREIVHYQRFGEGLRLATDRLDSKNFYACNPSFDKNCGK